MELAATPAPAPFEPIVRPRIVERLRRASRYRVTLLVAGAGFGKSVAIRHFLDEDLVAHVHFSLRHEHAALLGFARGLAEALEEFAPGAPKSVAQAYENALRADAPAIELAGWASVHFRDYAGTIVIDDFHEANDPACSIFLTELVQRLTHVRWLIATRDALELPVASWV
ncbi:MAG TPA: hypothetical protein VGD50_02740, partial [Candidatus Baltobacteraceae bacterium]